METQAFENEARGIGEPDEGFANIDFYLSQDEWEALSALAVREHCSIDDVISTAVENHLLEEKLKEIIPEKLLKEFVTVHRV
jgi:hypothetical protein